MSYGKIPDRAICFVLGFLLLNYRPMLGCVWLYFYVAMAWGEEDKREDGAAH